MGPTRLRVSPGWGIDLAFLPVWGLPRVVPEVCPVFFTHHLPDTKTRSKICPRNPLRVVTKHPTLRGPMKENGSGEKTQGDQTRGDQTPGDQTVTTRHRRGRPDTGRPDSHDRKRCTMSDTDRVVTRVRREEDGRPSSPPERRLGGRRLSTAARGVCAAHSGLGSLPPDCLFLGRPTYLKFPETSRFAAKQKKELARNRTATSTLASPLATRRSLSRRHCSYPPPPPTIHGRGE